MSLYKRKKDGPWYFLFYVAGKRYRGSTGTINQTEAQRIERRKYTAVEQGESLTPKKAPVLRDFFAEFLAFVEGSRLAKQSQRDYRNGVRLIKPTRLAGMRLDQISADDVETTKFHDSPYSTNCALRTIRRLLHKAKDWKRITEVPGISLVEAPPRNMVFTAEMEMRLLAKCPQPLYDVLTLVIDTGLRDGEVIAMEVQDINFERGYYANPRGKTRRARRHVPLSDRVLDLLRARCSRRLSGWLFPSVKSKSGHIELHKLQLRFRKLCRELGIPDELVIYCGRHTYGTDVMATTGDPFLVRATMGHADLKTTNGYMHPNLARAKAAIDQRNAEKLPQPVTPAVM